MNQPNDSRAGLILILFILDLSGMLTLRFAIFLEMFCITSKRLKT